jgi:hypothetical protein
MKFDDKPYPGKTDKQTCLKNENYAEKRMDESKMTGLRLKKE